MNYCFERRGKKWEQLNEADIHFSRSLASSVKTEPSMCIITAEEIEFEFNGEFPDHDLIEELVNHYCFEHEI